MLPTLLFLTASLPLLVSGHGCLTFPPARYGKSFPDDTNLRSPINTGISRGTEPGVPMFPCGGVSHATSKTPVTNIGLSVDLTWEMGYWTGAALHGGNLGVDISTNEQTWTPLGNISFAGGTGPDVLAATPRGMRVNIPASFSGQNAVLRWWWVAIVTPEQFISCSDVIIRGTSPGPSTTPAPVSVPVITPKPSTTGCVERTVTVTVTKTVVPYGPSVNPSPVTDPVMAWAYGTLYVQGQDVLYNGSRYRCLQQHRAINAWAPSQYTQSLWKQLS